VRVRRKLGVTNCGFTGGMRILRVLAVLALCAMTLPALRGTHAQGSYARAGYTATLSRLAHGVSGKATIIDERTVVLSEFNYDAGGPLVFAYLGAADTQQGYIDGIAIGGRLNNRLTPYVNEVVTLTLPAGQTLDGWNAISIWCRDFNFNFGSGEFVKPAQVTPTQTPQTPPTQTPQPAPSATAPSRSLRLFLPSVAR
jgi:hypothetical protein